MSSPIGLVWVQQLLCAFKLKPHQKEIHTKPTEATEISHLSCKRPPLKYVLTENPIKIEAYLVPTLGLHCICLSLDSRSRGRLMEYKYINMTSFNMLSRNGRRRKEEKDV